MASGSDIGNAYLTVKAKADSGFVSDLEGMGGNAGSLAGALFNTKFGAVLGTITSVLAGLGIGKAISDFIAGSVDVGKTFDKSMSQVAATMGTTVDQIGELRDFAQEMGSTTAFSATQAADALNYMALAGYDAETSMSMLPNVLNLAASGNIDLARASDMVTDAQSALGLNIDQTTTMVDQMAKTASTTNTSVEQLGDAFLTVGGTAKMMKGGTAELSQVLGLLADNGIKGSEGGTALRNVLLSLTAPTDQAAEMIDKLGLDVYDAEGNMRSMQDIMLDLGDALDGMTSEERTNAISTIFNKRDLKSVEALLGTNAERWNEVADAIDNAQGAAQQMADTQLDNLAGDVTMMESAFEGLQIRVSDMVTPAIRVLTQFATGALTKMNAFLDENKDKIEKAQEVIGKVANIIGTVLKPAIDLIGSALGVVGQIVGPLIDGFLAFADKTADTFQTVADTISHDMEDAKAAAWSAGDAIVNFLAGDWDTAAAMAQNAFDIIKENISGKMEAAKEKAIAFADAIGEKLGFPGLGDKVRGIFDGIRSFMEDPLGKAKEFIQKAMDKISGIITGANLTLPKIKLPHFRIYGGEVPWGIGGLGTKPTIEVDWYAKGGIVNVPHIIGVGEAGSEAIVPLTTPNVAPFADAVAERIDGRGGDTFVFNITADSETTLQRLVAEAQRARLQYA